MVMFIEKCLKICFNTVCGIDFGFEKSYFKRNLLVDGTADAQMKLDQRCELNKISRTS